MVDTLLVIAVLTLAFFYLGRRVYRAWSSPQSADSSCSSCPSCQGKSHS